jgi:hypothetical protein
MGKLIKDELTGVKTRQRRYQLRKERDGKCVICGKDRVTSLLCRDHQDKANLRAKLK